MEKLATPPPEAMVHSDVDTYGAVQAAPLFSQSQNMGQPENDDYTEVFAWGNDLKGQLGINSQTGKYYSLPKLVCFHTVIKSVSCGEDHAALITNQGYLYTMGSNQDGKLGIGNRTVSVNVPTLVESLDHVQLVSVSCGWTHTVALTASGQVYSWGLSEQGALGHGKTMQRAISQPILLTFFQKLNLRIKSASCGSMHTAFVTETGELYACGNGNEGQLGLGRKSRQYLPKLVSRTLEPVQKAACGIFHTCYITNSGQVFGMGGNNFGQLGNGTKKRSLTPVHCKSLSGKRVVEIACGHHSAAVTDQGELYVWGTGVFGEYLIPKRFGSFKGKESFNQVSVGGTFGAAVSSDGNVWTWGMNSNGELGVGDNEPRLYPVLVQSISHKNVELVSCGGSFALSTGTVVKDSTVANPHDTAIHPPSSVRSTVINKTPVPKSNENDFNKKRELIQQKRKTGRDRSFGQNIGNSSALNDSIKETSFQDDYIDPTMNSYIELLKRQKDSLEDALHQEKVARMKKENELRDLRESVQKHNYSQWNDDIIRRSKELEQEVDSLKYALVEERDRNSHLEEENRQLLRSLNEQIRMMEMRGGETELSAKLSRENEALRKELRHLEENLTENAKKIMHMDRALEQANIKIDNLDYANRDLAKKNHELSSTKEQEAQARAREQKGKTIEALHSGQAHRLLTENRSSSPQRVHISEYGPGPSYKERRLNESQEQFWRQKKIEPIHKPQSPHKRREHFAQVSPEVKRADTSGDKLGSPKVQRFSRVARMQSPYDEEKRDILRSPIKPELRSPIKDDNIGSGGYRSRSQHHHQAPPRRPCNFTKAPAINVISPSDNHPRSSETTPKFLSRATSKAEERLDGSYERGRQLDSYQQKLLRDLQRSVGSPFGGGVSNLRRSENRFISPYNAKTDIFNRSPHNVPDLTKSPLKRHYSPEASPSQE